MHNVQLFCMKCLLLVFSHFMCCMFSVFNLWKLNDEIDMVICLKRGAGCLHIIRQMPVPSPNLTISCLTFLAPTYLGSLGKESARRVFFCAKCQLQQVHRFTTNFVHMGQMPNDVRYCQQLPTDPAGGWAAEIALSLWRCHWMAEDILLVNALDNNNNVTNLACVWCVCVSSVHYSSTSTMYLRLFFTSTARFQQLSSICLTSSTTLPFSMESQTRKSHTCGRATGCLFVIIFWWR